MAESLAYDSIIHDLNTYGMCIVDNFLGKDADAVHQEAQRLVFARGFLKRGQTISGADGQEDLVRGDHIAWLDGTEPFSESFRVLIRRLDRLIRTCVATDKFGEVGLCRITKRTKAMLACYPGGGSRYVKHVDNPNFDGRRITCVYYLNKDWTQDNGGCLRIYPEDHPGLVATVHPLFDRLAMFFSDRRNPHEVLPASKLRISVTIWYLDDNELAMQSVLEQGGA